MGGALVQATTGLFYGVDPNGGTSGTLYSLSVGLGPFVKTAQSVARAGAVIQILGNNLTGATSVTFNGTPAAFTVVQSTLISATVPLGAVTGPIQVTTPQGTLSSYPNFVVRP